MLRERGGTVKFSCVTCWLQNGYDFYMWPWDRATADDRRSLAEATQEWNKQRGDKC